MDLPVNTLLNIENAAQLAGLSVRSLCRHCAAGKYPGATKGNGGWVIPLTSLPQAAQVRYWEDQRPTQASAPLAGLPAVASAPEAIDADAMFLAYRQAPKKSKTRADNLCAAVSEFEELRAAGKTKSNAAAHIKATYNISPVTLWRARDAVAGQPRELWAALLLPCYKGRTKEADLTGDAWDWIKSHYLSTSEPPAKVVIKEAKKEGKARGWVFPSDKTILRKLNALPGTQTILGRKGKEAFDATFPAAERDFTAYGLHDKWVSDGRRVDVFCRWPDGTVSRPFIVAWVDMRTRLVLGARGGVNPSQSLTLASFHSALVRVNIKPQRALLDNGREYAGKQVTGGQKTRYRFKIKEDDPVGALTRMGVVVDWARPYRGQEKPIESFWKHIANHLDKLPKFQGAYCGKDTVSKPEDFDRNKAIPIEVYAAKLAEVLEEFNREHAHRGQGMDGKAPAQLYEELMQAEPHKVWARPTSEDMRLLCLEQRMLTLNNKDASIRFKFDGYGENRYWSETLTDLPESARAKKYSVFYNPENPDIPILVYDGERMICEARKLGAVADKEAAAQHCINKATFKRPRVAAFKELQQAAPVALPAPAAPLSIQSVTIEKAAAPVAQPEPSKLIQIAPGVWQDSETGITIGKVKPEKQSNEPDTEAIEKYKRIQQEREAGRVKRFGTA